MAERRRGAALERALLEAAWEELSERGYAGMTMDGIAARAGTSRPVIARRWENKADLAIAAIRHQMKAYPSEVGDLGDLRSELLEYMELISKRTMALAAIFSVFASEYFQETGNTPSDLRSSLSAGQTQGLPPILERGVKRGEIDPQKLIPAIETLLLDLTRQYAIMTFSPPPADLREIWVDSIFLPLVRKS
ncbi:TetR/AcrR family transcriptional regulator [Nisaea sediminum]|uniref:TetR/AcrR family transcriptional regulator n=1 Tax=Nisaea sediminum TaxID=2775867 RepID=UPI0018671A41|nr:TetR/AcrR family transcriptional regulator [Nisaea sediminum]